MYVISTNDDRRPDAIWFLPHFSVQDRSSRSDLDGSDEPVLHMNPAAGAPDAWSGSEYRENTAHHRAFDPPALWAFGLGAGDFLLDVGGGAGDLTEDVRVGVLAGTTGEARLLQLTGLADARGTLAEGTGIVTDAGPLVADGSDRYVITAAGSSPLLEGRRWLDPPSPDMPVVVYLGEDTGETELLDALADGSIDAVARGEIGNLEATDAYGDGGVFAVTALDPEVELGGWTLSVTEGSLVACLDEKLDYLTDQRAIGYAEWVTDPEIFLRRARSWTP